MAVLSPTGPEIRGISLCAGLGSIDLGLHIAEPRYRTVCYVERDSFPASTLVARMADQTLDQAPVWSDLRTFDGRPWRGRVHIITGGYPCQPFSYAGRRRGADDPRHLWPDVARILSEVLPEYAFFENVVGHLSLGFRDVCRDLQDMGYRVAARVVSAAEVGAPHTRERLFILAHANIQRVGQPGVHQVDAAGGEVFKRSEPDGQPDWYPERRCKLEPALADDTGAGSDPGGRDLFPPLPGGFAEWRGILEAQPELEPCIHGLADGMADRMERSAAAGNGVVPLAAAIAFSTLRAELMGAD